MRMNRKMIMCLIPCASMNLWTISKRISQKVNSKSCCRGTISVLFFSIVQEKNFM